MKRGTPNHPKTMRLARILRCSRATAVGHLELLFHFTAQLAPQGDLGRWTDEEISDACAFEGPDASKFITAMVNSGWLELSIEHRLVVHDWHDHADQSVRKYLERKQLSFVNSVHPKSDKNSLARGNGIGIGNGIGNGKEAVGDFEAWWACYPNKTAKKRARLAWNALAPSSYQAAVLMAAVQHQCLAHREPRFIPHATTWLHGERWGDPPSPPPGVRVPSVMGGVVTPRVKSAAEIHREQDAEVERKRREFEQTPAVLRDILTKAALVAFSQKQEREA